MVSMSTHSVRQRFVLWAAVGLALVAAASLGLTLAAVPLHLRDNTLKAKEAKLRSDLMVVNSAVRKFREDTNANPESLRDLELKSSPSFGVLDRHRVPINVKDWEGPYLIHHPIDVIAGTDFDYDADRGRAFSSSGAIGSNGVRYREW